MWTTQEKLSRDPAPLIVAYPSSKGPTVKILLQDIRYALRQLVKNPGFSITAVLSLTCGIAATTAVFSVVWAVLMNPYPYANSDRMVHINLRGDKPGEERGFGTTGPQWQQFRQNPVIEDAIITDGWSLTVTGQDIPEDVQGCNMSSNARTLSRSSS